jgi:hypothetical protein
MSTVLEVMLESANDLGTSDDDDEEDFIDGDDQVCYYTFNVNWGSQISLQKNNLKPPGIRLLTSVFKWFEIQKKNLISAYNEVHINAL